MENDINYVCSLGGFCQVGSFMKENGLKITSYPFDWTLSTPEIVSLCLNDNFNMFLDKSKYVTVYDDVCGHTVFDKDYFPHRNPLLHEEDYNHYLRCVERFKRLLDYKEHKLFMMIEYKPDYENRNIEDVKADIMIFNNQLKRYTDNYTLLYIFTSVGDNHSHSFDVNGNVEFLHIHLKSYSKGFCYSDEPDNVYMREVFANRYNNIKLKELY